MPKTGRKTGPTRADGAIQDPVVDRFAGDLELLGPNADLSVGGRLSVPGGVIVLGSSEIEAADLPAGTLAAEEPSEVDIFPEPGDPSITKIGLTDAIARTFAIQSGHYFYNRMDGTSSNQTLTQDLLFLTDVGLWAGTLDRIGISVVTAQPASTVRLGVYADNGGVPGALIAEANSSIGTYPLNTTTTGIKEAGITAAIPKNGRYWLACVAQGAAGLVIRGGGVTSALPMSLGTSLPTDDDTFRPARTQAGVTGALPGTLTLAAGPNSSRARILLRYQ